MTDSRELVGPTTNVELELANLRSSYQQLAEQTAQAIVRAHYQRGEAEKELSALIAAAREVLRVFPLDRVLDSQRSALEDLRSVLGGS